MLILGGYLLILSLPITRLKMIPFVSVMNQVFAVFMPTGEPLQGEGGWYGEFILGFVVVSFHSPLLFQFYRRLLCLQRLP